MTDRHYSFVTHWRVRAPLTDVWRVIQDGSKWPDWWHGVEQVVTVKPGGPNNVGLVTNQIWKGALPYKLHMHITVVQVDVNRRIEITSAGELAGTGIMSFSAAGDVTEVVVNWDVATTSTWMNIVGPLLAPVFRWNHAWLMNQGAKGLARTLNCELLSETNA